MKPTLFLIDIQWEEKDIDQEFAVLLRGGRGIADCLVASLKWCGIAMTNMF